MIKPDGKKADDRFSDVLWTLYGKICPDTTKLEYVIVEWAANSDTMALLAETAAAANHFDPHDLTAHVKDESHWSPSDDEGKITGNHQDFYALLHSPNTVGIAFMAKDYSRDTNRKDIQDIIAFYSAGMDINRKPIPEWSLIVALGPYTCS